MDISIHDITITELHGATFQQHQVQVSLLRLDLIHPVISGNKYMKLVPYFQLYQQQACNEIVSYGGAFSNHLHALAYTCHLLKIKCTGIVRGDEVSNYCLDDCKRWGMQLQFLNRTQFDIVAYEMQGVRDGRLYIPMGGIAKDSNTLLQQIIQEKLQHNFTHIACPVGTGTTLRALIDAAPEHCIVEGFLAVRDEQLITEFGADAKLIDDFVGKGFGKADEQLLNFILAFYEQYGIALDVVYTAKMMQGVFARISSGFYAPNSHILCIHTGGVQGNRGYDCIAGLYKQ